MDISIMIGDIKFNYRVAAVIKNGDKILLHKNKKEPFYAVPGGRIQIGEDSVTALKREFKEEIGVEVGISNMKAIVENFFNHNGKKYHEVMLIYNVEFEKNPELYNSELIHVNEEGQEIDFEWKNIEDIRDIDLRPKALKSVLLAGDEAPFNIINID